MKKIFCFVLLGFSILIAGCCLFSNPRCTVAEFVEEGCCKIIKLDGEEFWVYGRGSAQLGRLGYKELSGTHRFVQVLWLNNLPKSLFGNRCRTKQWRALGARWEISRTKQRNFIGKISKKYMN